MKRKIIIIMYIILICITLKLVYNTVIGSILIEKYNNEEYSESQAKTLTYINFPQSYIANYNYGNIFYQNGKYESAIEEYEKALNSIVPKNKECSIRINYALAICKTVQVDESDQNSITEAMQTYENAIDILTQHGCANKNDNNGHSQKAETLKKDIKKEIERLKKLQKNSNEENNEEKEKDKNQTKDNSETIEEKIQNIKQEATKEQRELENEYKFYNKSFERVEKNW